ncbi:MAG: dienelactone hydrolase family protein [Myxococcota bacterium]
MSVVDEVDLGILVHPEDGPSPGVVMIHDVWGLSDHTADLAGRLAADGFAVLAVDFYRREDEVAIENPGAWMRALDDPRFLSDVQAAVDFLKQSPASAGQKAGVVGFCMGGMYALMAACHCDGLSAAVPFYGLLSHEHGLLHDEAGLDPAKKPRQPLDFAADLRCPLLGFFGGKDEFVPLEDVRELERRLAATGQESEIVLYPDAGHAFVNDTRPDAYRPADADDAWRRMVAFFNRTLR